ncbi:MAG: hypothetical protein NT003_04350 [Candidatus Magasanikbacteria bacterium]|nr:hypothetical protein [Candidatus Magasanikbacteria bacterium]
MKLLVILALLAGCGKSTSDEQKPRDDYPTPSVERPAVEPVEPTDPPAATTKTEAEMKYEIARTVATLSGVEAQRQLKRSYCGFAVRHNIEVYFDPDLKIALNSDDVGDLSGVVIAAFDSETKDKKPHRLLIASPEFGQYYWVYAKNGDITRDAKATEEYCDWASGENDGDGNTASKDAIIFPTQISDQCCEILFAPEKDPKLQQDKSDDASEERPIERIKGPKRVGGNAGFSNLRFPL